MVTIRRESKLEQTDLDNGWYLAKVDPEEDQPEEGDYGEETLNCTLMVPRSDWIVSGEFEEVPEKRFKCCRPWTGVTDDIEPGQLVWIRVYYGRNLIMLVECGD